MFVTVDIGAGKLTDSIISASIWIGETINIGEVKMSADAIDLRGRICHSSHLWGTNPFFPGSKIYLLIVLIVREAYGSINSEECKSTSKHLSGCGEETNRTAIQSLQIAFVYI